MKRLHSRSAEERGTNERGSLGPSFHYEIVNLTSYGGDTGYPVTTDATLWDLRVTHQYSDGASEEIILFDLDGVRRVDVDSAAVYLRSEPIGLPDRAENARVIIRGKIRPTLLSVATGGRREANIHVHPEFVLEATVKPGLYEALTVVGENGHRYAIGTFGILLHENVPLPAERITRTQVDVRRRDTASRRRSLTLQG